MSVIGVANDIYLSSAVQGVVPDGQGSHGESSDEKQWKRTRLVNHEVGHDSCVLYFLLCERLRIYF